MSLPAIIFIALNHRLQLSPPLNDVLNYAAANYLAERFCIAVIVIVAMTALSKQYSQMQYSHIAITTTMVAVM